jgi:anti-anti-sigma factor
MEYLTRKVQNDVVIEVVDLVRATYKEAGDLKKILEEEMDKGFVKIVVDISHCLFIDSTFLGAMVYTLKNIAKLGGDIRIVISDSIIRSLMAKVGTLHVFNVYNTVEEAVLSFDSPEIINHYLISEIIN